MKIDITKLAGLIGKSEAARRLGVSGEMVNVWLGQGKLKFLATAHGRLIDPVDVEKLRREREELRAERAGAAIRT
jgi:predicted site-specific integrase-resolvase